MNSKFSAVVSLFLLLVGVMLWSASMLAAEPRNNETPVADSNTISLAREANEQAAKEAALSVREATRLDLDIRLVGPASMQMAAQ